MAVDLHPDVAYYRETTFACPVQIEGRLHSGEWFYFRYRFGCASVGIGGSPEQANYDALTVGRDQATVRHVDDIDGAFAGTDERDAVFAAAYAKRRAVTS